MEENEERLLEAAQNGETETLKTLIGIGVNVNAAVYSGMTALMHATRNNHAECVKILLEAGADVYHVNELGRTAIKMAEEKAMLKFSNCSGSPKKRASRPPQKPKRHRRKSRLLQMPPCRTEIRPLYKQKLLRLCERVMATLIRLQKRL